MPCDWTLPCQLHLAAAASHERAAAMQRDYAARARSIKRAGWSWLTGA
jgi:hypothetical protein